ncbi:helix-turn-helix domain-containing protein [Pseudomonas bubulae]|uniref:helix-turn-helix domain-containing protein n=1 Tax=Pseudomonas bubulae TaxID=2316085 RepID=UPI001F427307|nr:helix-turn-helix domain-containing protein [Pseudomonas bubulae]MCF3191788.1 helix-turn-helix domain-containing protein [Pseudomonas bubulae]
MPKAIYRPEYDIFLAILKARRIDSGMTQADCSHALGRPQSFMSDVERGVRRLDIIQIRDLCEVLGCALIDLIQEFESSLNKAGY